MLQEILKQNYTNSSAFSTSSQKQSFGPLNLNSCYTNVYSFTMYNTAYFDKRFRKKFCKTLLKKKLPWSTGIKVCKTARRHQEHRYVQEVHPFAGGSVMFRAAIMMGRRSPLISIYVTLTGPRCLHEYHFTAPQTWRRWQLHPRRWRSKTSPAVADAGFFFREGGTRVDSNKKTH